MISKEKLDNCRAFFKKVYPSLYRRSGLWTPRKVDNNERKYCLEIQRAIDACSTRSRSIMQERYLKGQKVIAVQEMIHLYGHSSYSEADQKARNEFYENLAIIDLELCNAIFKQ